MSGKKEITYNKGSYIYIEGNSDVENIYIVEKGEINLFCQNPKIKKFRNKALQGDIFGFISSLSRHARIDSAVAEVDSVIVSITRNEFIKELYNNPELAVKIVDYFSEELRNYDELILTHGKNDFIGSEESELFHLGEYNFKNKNIKSAYYILKKYQQLYANGKYLKNADEMLSEINKSGKQKELEEVHDKTFKEYNDRDVVFCEHEPGHELFIIKKGKVKIFKNHGESEILLSILKEGDILGELAIISHKPRNATAVSYGKSVLLPISRESLFKLMSKKNNILLKILEAISKRIWFIFIQLESQLYSKPITKIYAFLENKLLEDRIPWDSKASHIFNFGIDEILKMNSLDKETASDALEKLSKDLNLSFNFNQTRIKDTGQLINISKYYKKIDNKIVHSDDKEVDDIFNINLNEQAELINELQEAEKILAETSKMFSGSESEIREKNELKEVRDIFEFKIPFNTQEGDYKVYVEDQNTSRKLFSKKMKPGQRIRFSYKRIGNAKITIMCDDELFSVVRVDENDKCLD